MDIDLVTRSGHIYAQAKTQPVKSVTGEEVKEFMIVIKVSKYNVVDPLWKLPV